MQAVPFPVVENGGTLTRLQAMLHDVAGRYGGVSLAPAGESAAGQVSLAADGGAVSLPPGEKPPRA